MYFGSELEALRGSCPKALSLSLWARESGWLNQGRGLEKVHREKETVPWVK